MQLKHKDGDLFYGESYARIVSDMIRTQYRCTREDRNLKDKKELQLLIPLLLKVQARLQRDYVNISVERRYLAFFVMVMAKKRKKAFLWQGSFYNERKWTASASANVLWN